MLDEVTAQVIPYTVDIPAGPVEQSLHPVRGRITGTSAAVHPFLPVDGASNPSRARIAPAAVSCAPTALSD